MNGELEASLAEGVKPDQATCSMSDLESFIRAKYELRSFVEGGDGRLPLIAPPSAKSSKEGGVAMLEFCGLLIIRLIRGTHLPSVRATDLLGKTDAYCEFHLAERKVWNRGTNHR